MKKVLITRHMPQQNRGTLIGQESQKSRASLAFRMACVALACFFVLTACAQAPGNDSNGVSESIISPVTVYFLNAGDADASLIVTDNGQTMLIDTGLNKDAESLVNRLCELGVRTLDYLVISHNHKDHIGGASQILQAFTVKNVIVSALRTGSKQEKQFDQALEEKNMTPVQAKAGDRFAFGDREIVVIGPLRTGYKEENDYSLVIKIDNLLFTGDAENESLTELLQEQADFAADVLKVPHHGKAEKSTQAFFTAVSPQIAVISCKEGTKENLPEEGVTAALDALGIETYITSRGDIVVRIESGEISASQR